MTSRGMPRQLGVATGSEHKAVALEDSIEIITGDRPAILLLPPERRFVEPDYVRGVALIAEKTIRALEANPRAVALVRHGGVTVAQDVNIAIGFAGHDFQTVRKPEGVAGDEELVDSISQRFRQFPQGSVLTTRIEAASGWVVGIGRNGKPLTMPVVERAYMQLMPEVVEKLKDPRFLQDYLAFCQMRMREERIAHENVGAPNVQSPLGIRWDDLYRFTTRQIPLEIVTWEGQSREDALAYLVRGFTPTSVAYAFDVLQRHPSVATYMRTLANLPPIDPIR